MKWLFESNRLKHLIGIAIVAALTFSMLWVLYGTITWQHFSLCCTLPLPCRLQWSSKTFTTITATMCQFANGIGRHGIGSIAWQGAWVTLPLCFLLYV